MSAAKSDLAHAGLTPSRAHEAGPILIVDDDPDILAAVAAALSDAGYQVHTAQNGDEALGLLRQGERPSLILLDLMMPVVDGWAVLNALANSTNLRAIPVIVISASQNAARPLEHAKAVLAKPVRLSAILDVVSETCRGSCTR
jgi:CheY-like chemotaxis protein